MINLYAANAMLGSNTKLVIRSSDNPSLSRRLKTNDCMLQYNHVTTDVFIDTVMIVGGWSGGLCLVYIIIFSLIHA